MVLLDGLKRDIRVDRYGGEELYKLGQHVLGPLSRQYGESFESYYTRRYQWSLRVEQSGLVLSGIEMAKQLVEYLHVIWGRVPDYWQGSQHIKTRLIKYHVAIHKLEIAQRPESDAQRIRLFG